MSEGSGVNVVWRMIRACEDPEERFNIMCDNLIADDRYGENCRKLEMQANRVLPGGMKRPKLPKIPESDKISFRYAHPSTEELPDPDWEEKREEARRKLQEFKEGDERC